MNPTTLPSDFLGVALVVLLLGMRHGFDPDHLAAIDAMTCHNARPRPRLARVCGALFSLGHGAVVVAVALGGSLAAATWRPPSWLEATGAWLSIALLLLLGGLNVASVLRTPAGQRAQLQGWRSGAFGRLLRADHPLTVMAVGTLFALSFDTFSQAALFAVAASRLDGWPSALLLGALFTAGMLLTDGANGWWVFRLVGRSDRTAQVASRVMGLAVAGVSLLTAAMVLATLLVPAADAWAADKQLWFGTGIGAVLVASFVIGQRLAGRGPRAAVPVARSVSRGSEQGLRP